MNAFLTRKITSTFLLSLLTIIFLSQLSNALATSVELTITNNSPDGGVSFTPVWVGFHNGSFDSYDGGAATSPELERLVEDGNNAPISAAFDADETLAPSAPPVATQTGIRQQGNLGGGPVGPGTVVSQTFDIDAAGANRYLSYASMVLPSNDYYIANGNAVAHDLATLDGAPIDTMISFNIGVSVNDAGTEVNFENLGAGMVDESIAGLGLLGPGFVGQSEEDTGTSEDGVNVIVSGDPFTSDLLSAFPNLDFNDASLYPNGIATVKITVVGDPSPVPEPSTIALSILGFAAVVGMGRRRYKKGLAQKVS